MPRKLKSVLLLSGSLPLVVHMRKAHCTTWQPDFFSVGDHAETRFRKLFNLKFGRLLFSENDFIYAGAGLGFDSKYISTEISPTDLSPPCHEFCTHRQCMGLSFAGMSRTGFVSHEAAQGLVRLPCPVPPATCLHLHQSNCILIPSSDRIFHGPVGSMWY